MRFDYDDANWVEPTWIDHLCGWIVLAVYGIGVCTAAVAGFMWLVELWRKVL